MQNKIKLVMDDEKILHDGIYDLNSIYSIIDDLLVNRKGLRKDGSFYIDDNPSDSAGVGMACIFTLAGKKWFRENVKELFWYRDISHYKLDHRYKVENAKETVFRLIGRTADGYGLELRLSRLVFLIIPVSFQPRLESGAFSHQSAWYCGIILLHQKDRRTKGESDTDVRV